MKNSVDSYLWLGGIFSEKSVLQGRGLSPAGNRWMQGLVSGIVDSGNKIVCMGHRYEAMWPRGKLFPTAIEDFAEQFQHLPVHYTNLPVIRSKSLSFSYRKTYEKYRKSHPKPTAVIVYNSYPYSLNLARYIQECDGVRWFCILADYDPIRTDLWSRVRSELSGASGVAFLSDWAFKNAPFESKMHFIGGLDRSTAHNAGKESGEGGASVVYTGQLSEARGLTLLLDAFSLTNNLDSELILCGKARPKVSKHLRELAQTNSRIKYMGLLPEDELRKVQENAGVLVNPRQTSLDDNPVDFPSKLLDYIQYGKPIVSTITKGMGERVCKWVIPVVEETPECLAKALSEALSLSKTERAGYRRFLLEEAADLQWAQQAKRFMRWIESKLNS